MWRCLGFGLRLVLLFCRVFLGRRRGVGSFVLVVVVCRLMSYVDGITKTCLWATICFCCLLVWCVLLWWYLDKTALGFWFF